MQIKLIFLTKKLLISPIFIETHVHLVSLGKISPTREVNAGRVLILRRMMEGFIRF